MMPSPICLRFEIQTVLRAASRALEKVGNIIEARILMMAMTTRSSIRVKPERDIERDTAGNIARWRAGPGEGQVPIRASNVTAGCEVFMTSFGAILDVILWAQFTVASEAGIMTNDG